MRALSLLMLLVACGDPTLEVDSYVFEPGELDQAGPPTAIDTSLVLHAPISAAKDGVAYLRVTGAAPGQTVRVAGSYVGAGTSSFCPVWLNRNCVDLQTVGRVASAVADANGEATFVYNVPDTVETRVHLQALGRRDASTRLLPNKSVVVSVDLIDYGVPADRVLVSHRGTILAYENPSGTQSTLVNVSNIGFTSMNDFAEGPDGNIYVLVADTIHRYDGATGVYVDEFIGAADHDLGSATCLSFGPDGNLYVSSNSTDEILRFDTATGDFLDVFATGVTVSMQDFIWVDGDLFVAAGSSSRRVMHYDGLTGDEVAEHFLGFNGTYRIAYDQGLFVVAATTASTARYYDTDWNLIGEVGTDYFTAWGLYAQGGELFLADPGFDRIWVYTFGTGSLRRNFTAPGGSAGYSMSAR